MVYITKHFKNVLDQVNLLFSLDNPSDWRPLKHFFFANVVTYKMKYNTRNIFFENICTLQTWLRLNARSTKVQCYDTVYVSRCYVLLRLCYYAQGESIGLATNTNVAVHGFWPTKCIQASWHTDRNAWQAPSVSRPHIQWQP